MPLQRSPSRLISDTAMGTSNDQIAKMISDFKSQMLGDMKTFKAEMRDVKVAVERSADYLSEQFDSLKESHDDLGKKFNDLMKVADALCVENKALKNRIDELEGR